MHSFWKTFRYPLIALGLALPLAAGCHGPRGGGNLSEAEIAERMQDVAEYGLDYVDASDQQVERVNQLLASRAPDVVRFRAEQRALSAELRAELAKERVDPTRVEQLRQRALDLFDRASKQGSETLLATSDVLTTEQRKELIYKWEKYQR